MKDTNKKNILLLIMVLFLGLAVSGATFAYLAIDNLNNSTTINGTTYNFNVDIDVSPIKSGNLIPVKDNLIVETLNSTHICEDIREYGLCSLYKITLSNNGSVQNMIGNLETIESTYISNNLKYQLYTKNGSTYTALSDALVVNNDKNAINEFKTNNNDVVVNIPTNNSKDVYLAIWISDPNTNQLVDQDKSYKGIITFASNRGDKVTSTFVDTSQTTYTVTFDANGGSVPISSKSVILGERYGALPIPTRSGYTFKGWNGKNLISDDEIRNYSNWQNEIVTSGDYPTNVNNPGFLLKIDTGKTYTISITLLGTSKNEIPPYLYLCKIVNNSGYLQSYLTTTRIEKLNYTFTVAEGETYFLRIGSTKNESAFNTNISKLTTIQLEESAAVTSYEPYYVTSNTTVVQNKNHTLTAIWEEN